MGLSSKQVASDHGLDWSKTLLQSTNMELSKASPARRQQHHQQQKQQQSEPLKCPRCGSTNTKFCYYNNYNKSQPRHFCKACKRHWTKGGTLRNVPVGGGRKNKRLKTLNATTTTTTNPVATAAATIPSTTPTSRRNASIYIQSQQRSQNLHLDHQTNMSDIVFQALLPPQSSPQNGSITSLNKRSFLDSNCSFIDSTLAVAQTQNLQFPFSSSSSFEATPSFQSSDVYNYTATKVETLVVDSTISTIMPTTSCGILSQTWQNPFTSSTVMDMPSYWNWNDIDTLASADLNVPWYDTEINP